MVDEERDGAASLAGQDGEEEEEEQSSAGTGAQDDSNGSTDGSTSFASDAGDDDEFDKDRALSTIRKQRDEIKTLKESKKELDALKRKQQKAERAAMSESEQKDARIQELEEENSRLKSEREQRLGKDRRRTLIAEAQGQHGLTYHQAKTLYTDITEGELPGVEVEWDGERPKNLQQVVKAARKADSFYANGSADGGSRERVEGETFDMNDLFRGARS